MADGTKNLIPVRTEAEAKAKGRRGGIASGKARRAKKTMREWAEIIGSIEVPVTQPDGTALDGGDLDAGIVMAQYRKAHKGDTKAAEFLAKLKGAMEDKVAVAGSVTNIVVGTPEAAEGLQRALATGAQPSEPKE